jgi:hypothetical protein
MEPACGFIDFIVLLSASISSLLEFTLDMSLVLVEAVELLRVGVITTIGIAPAALLSVLLC